MVQVKPAIAATKSSLQGLPGGAPPLQFSFSYMQLETAFRHIQFNLIPILDQGQGSPNGALRRDMQYDRSKGRPAHPRIRDADHVPDTLLEQLGRDRKVANLRHPRPADR